MRILLIGEYSNVHATLATGLRTLGHEVCVGYRRHQNAREAGGHQTDDPTMDTASQDAGL